MRYFMDSWTTVFLGLMALGSVVQVAFLVALAVLGLRAMRVAGEIRTRAESELRDPIAHVKEAARNVEEISAIVAGEARAVQESARHAADEVRDVKESVVRTARVPWVELSAFAKGVARAVTTFRATPGSAPVYEPPAPAPETFAAPPMPSAVRWPRRA